MTSTQETQDLKKIYYLFTKEKSIPDMSYTDFFRRYSECMNTYNVYLNRRYMPEQGNFTETVQDCITGKFIVETRYCYCGDPSAGFTGAHHGIWNCRL